MREIRNLKNLKKKGFLLMAVIICAFSACKNTRGTANKAEAKNELAKVEVKSGLTDKSWKLIELNGVAVESTANIIFKSDGTVSGSFGCNNFNGVYTQQEGNRIKFDKLVNTQMMCLNMSVEDEFKRVLQIADNYNLTDTQLVLNRARMAPLARFEIVK